jgi:signal transduction histidine kinase/FixJ family two-component response regulator
MQPVSAAQIKEQDSLRSVIIDKHLHDTIKLGAATKLLSSFLSYNMYDSIDYYANTFYSKSVKVKYFSGMVYFKVYEGIYSTLTGKQDEALKYYFTALEHAEESGQPRLIAYAAKEVGSCYSRLFMYDKAGEYLLRSIKIYREINDRNALMNAIPTMGVLANVYMQTGNTQRAIDIHLSVVRLVDSLGLTSRPSLGDKAVTLYYLGSLYSHNGKPREAILSFQESYQILQQIDHPESYWVLFELALLFAYDTLNVHGKEIGDDRISADIALSYLDVVEPVARERQKTSHIIQCLALRAWAYLMKGDHRKALEITREVEQMYLAYEDIEQDIKGNILLTLSEIYEKCGECDRALIYYKERSDLRDTLDKVNMAARISQLTESFEIEQVQGQLKRKEEQLAKNRVITYLFVGISALILLLAGVVFYFLRQKQKQNREIEKARYRAEQSEKFKERFLASMSHEIRTPLNSVIGMTGLLLDDPQPPKTEMYLRNIRQAGEHMTGIINEVLDLYRIDAGKMELHEIPFSMKDLMEEIGNLLGGKAREKELQLIIHKAEGTPDWFRGDAGRIRQVLLNLAGNAIKFTERGSVQVEMRVEAPKDGKAITNFSVEDTGIGIPRELQAVIFEEFVQAGQTNDQRVVGTGLGLSISRKLVERMGGTLVMESEPGKGSLFSFTLPLELSTEEAFRAIQEEQDLSLMAMKGSYRILVVEDNPSNQIVTQGMLEKILPESAVIIAQDGVRALSLLEKEKFDLVLMDIRMPGIDGYETTRRLRLLDNENAHVPVIALTASVIRSDIDHCLEAGMNGYVPKPVSRGVLAKTIRDVLNIPSGDHFRVEASRTENFLSGLQNRPGWSDRLLELCNGKKGRFNQMLNLFLEQSETETGNWQEWIDQKQHEPLAFSIHRLLPAIRIFLDEKMTAMAVVLDQELRKGWQEGQKEQILMLKQEIAALHKEAYEIKQNMDG